MCLLEQMILLVDLPMKSRTLLGKESPPANTENCAGLVVFRSILWFSVLKYIKCREVYMEDGIGFCLYQEEYSNNTNETYIWHGVQEVLS